MGDGSRSDPELNGSPFFLLLLNAGPRRRYDSSSLAVDSAHSSLEFLSGAWHVSSASGQPGGKFKLLVVKE